MNVTELLSITTKNHFRNSKYIVIVEIFLKASDANGRSANLFCARAQEAGNQSEIRTVKKKDNNRETKRTHAVLLQERRRFATE